MLENDLHTGALSASPSGEQGGYVRSSSSNDRSDYSLARAFKNAGAGIAYAVRTQRNIRIDLVFATLAIVLGLLLGIDAQSFALVFLCIGVVLGLSLIHI